MYKEIKRCRVCKNEELTDVLDLGEQFLTGVFPKDKEQKDLPSFPLKLVKCSEDNDGCGLLQLKGGIELSQMYGDNYGYRSGLNKSMVDHLGKKVEKILSQVNTSEGDLIIDVGSNDGTLLSFYPKNLNLVGVDPTGSKFQKYYQQHIHLITEFFPTPKLKDKFGDKKAKVITSIAMFYDLEEPLNFVNDVHDFLADDGVWVFEQSYMPKMIEVNAYDTVCHEHIEYYRLKQIKYMTDRAGLKLLDVEFNNTNGGSFSVTAAKKESKYKENKELIDAILQEETKKELNTLKPYQEFEKRVKDQKEQLVTLLNQLHSKGKQVHCYGASTKGNVVLQYCGITEELVPFVAEVNEDKYGAYTPGTKIPIISEKEARAKKPDYFLVLPWHFKEFIVKKEQEYLNSGGKLIFPLPQPHVVSN